MKKRTETIYQFDAIFDPNGVGYTVTVPKLPGLVTEGDSLKEAREMAKDAIRCYLGSILKERLMSVFPKARLRQRIKVIA
ncbi:MAG: type II toxin-antitoxin system HicB family antitoxin [Candidatus Sungbacteria bacterium]|nr:type II toxin-antitoxin system HicB family antitoxin [Candidatus Sungbacteria bacterium]